MMTTNSDKTESGFLVNVQCWIKVDLDDAVGLMIAAKAKAGLEDHDQDPLGVLQAADAVIEIVSVKQMKMHTPLPEWRRPPPDVPSRGLMGGTTHADPAVPLGAGGLGGKAGVDESRYYDPITQQPVGGGGGDAGPIVASGVPLAHGDEPI